MDVTRECTVAPENAVRSQCFTLREMAELTQREIEETIKVANRFNPSVTASCTEFYKQVRLLESSVVCAYKIAVFLGKRTTDLRELCDLWKTASEICDAILNALKSVKDSHPQCGTPELYDL